MRRLGSSGFNWKTCLVPFDAYITAVLIKSGPTWDLLMDSDLVIGGLDFTSDVM